MMLETVLRELLLAVGRFFINPLLYVALLAAVFLGYQRVKRERKYFHIRILNGWTELRTIFKVGILLSLVLSVITIAAGLTIPVQLLVMISAVTIVFLILFQFHFLSAVVTWTIAFGVLLWMDWQNVTFELFGYQLSGIPFDTDIIITLTIVVGLLLIAEGILMRKNGNRFASPILEKTSRGLKSISYMSKKMWVIPVFFIIPSDVFDGFAPWWPLFTIGSEQFGLVLFPVVIGFQQITRLLLPSYFYPKLGRYIRILGEITVLGGAAAYFSHLIGYIMLALALVVRFVLSIGYKLSEHKDHYAVTPVSNGAMIAAVLPDSPAEKMGLLAGEVIKRVNGKDVFTEREVYEALQINAAYCRLEVLDDKKELRLTQYVVHNEDHYQIGLLFIQ